MTTTSAPIAEQVAILNAGLSGRLPSDVREAFGAEHADIAAVGMPATQAVGTPMPDGQLLDAHGADTSLAAIRKGRTSVVVLYRGAWCPYCNLTLKTYETELLPALARRGVALIAVSPQRPDGALSMQEKNELTFDVLSDPGNQLARALGVLRAPLATTTAAQGKLGLTVADTTADGTSDAPMPTVMIADSAGTLRWLDVHPDFTTRTEPAEIVAALDALIL